MQDYSDSKTSVPEQMPGADPNGIIMVESNPHAYKSQASAHSEGSTVNKKKNKKKKAKTDGSDKSSQGGTHGQDKIVTLKNPMFFNNPGESMNSMMRNPQTPPFSAPLPPEPQSASIVRNENGMYTIRNPSFQNAFGSTAPSTYAPRPPQEPDASRNFPSTQYSSFDRQTPRAIPPTPVQKCSSVIGSEMKNVLQRRKEQEFAANMDPYSKFSSMRPLQNYTHFGANSGVHFNNNGIDCDDNFVSQPSSGFQPYASQMMSNYDDLRLQPGQMLNSEVRKVMQFRLTNISKSRLQVTIHNVTESKIFQNQVKKNPSPIGTPRDPNIKTVGTLFGDLVITRPNAAPEKTLNGNGEWLATKI